MHTKKINYLRNFIIILFIIAPFTKFFFTNEDFIASKFTSIIIKKYYTKKRIPILTYKIIASNSSDVIDVTDKLYNLSEVGDTLIKKENSNQCVLIKKDTTYYLKLTE